jgi:hypothetical protein
VAELTLRLVQRIQDDFASGTADMVIDYLGGLSADAFGGQNHERIQAAMVLAAAGDWDRFIAVFRLLRLDWRDVLVAGGLADADWPHHLDAALPAP